MAEKPQGEPKKDGAAAVVKPDASAAEKPAVDAASGGAAAGADKDPPAPAPKVDEPVNDEVGKVALVKMTNRWVEDGGPTEAEVHPDEVENWRTHGWTEA